MDVEFDYFDCDDEIHNFDNFVNEMKDKVASITYNQIKKYIRADNIASSKDGHFLIQVKLLEQCSEDDDIYVCLDDAINGYLAWCVELEDDPEMYDDDEEEIKIMEERIEALNEYSNILLKLSKSLKKQADNRKKILTKKKTEMVK
jgi:hypothetical protein